jgi:hypothetical protein
MKPRWPVLRIGGASADRIKSSTQLAACRKPGLEAGLNAAGIPAFAIYAAKSRCSGASVDRLISVK